MFAANLLVKVSRMFCCVFLFFAREACAFLDDSLLSSVTSSTKGYVTSIASIDGRDVSRCAGAVLGTSGVECYKFSDGKKVFLKKNFYISGERFDSVIASVLLRYLSNNIEITPISPKLHFAVDDKRNVVGIVSYELSGFQSIAALYRKCGDQECISEKNSNNPFYCHSMENQLSKPLSLLYALLFLIGGGDTNPGNICMNPEKICELAPTSTYGDDLFGSRPSAKGNYGMMLSNF